MMETVFPFALLCFTSLFTITSPLSTMPVFLTMTQSLDEKERRAVAIRATLVACCALLLFVLAGQFLFKFFGISTNGFRIVGGIIIFRIGFDMLQAKYTPMNLRKEEIKEYANDVSVAPLGIPLLCGPGAIANAIVLMQEAHSFEMKTAMIVAIVLVYVVTFCLLRWAQRHDAADGFDSDGDSSGMFCQRGASHPDGNPAWKLEDIKMKEA